MSAPYPTCVYCKFQQPITIRTLGENCAITSVAASAVSTQKKIWRTVRVPASEYTMNRAALNVYTPAVLNGINPATAQSQVSCIPMFHHTVIRRRKALLECDREPPPPQALASI